MTTTVGISSYGVHVPRWRLARAQIGAALGTSAGRGTRSVAGYDEDTTSMGVQAATTALVPGVDIRGIVFASALPAYADKTNAAVVHAALDLEATVSAYDLVGACRSGMGALTAAADAAAAGRTTLAVLSDIRTGLPGSVDERIGGDGAAAVVFDSGTEVIAELIGRGAATAEFLDRWRIPGESAGHLWEERFAVDRYVELAGQAVRAALDESGTDRTAIGRIAVAGMHRRAVAAVTRELRGEATVVPDRADAIGVTGTAEPGFLLATALDEAQPDELILLVHLGDGADALILRATDVLPRWRDDRVVGTASEQIADGREIDYHRALIWRGHLRPEPPRRPDPDRPAGPPAARNAGWKFGLVGSRCTVCDTRHLPASRVCRSCHSVDRMRRDRIAGEWGVVTTFQADRLAYSMNPPLTGAVVDFPGGGRLVCEVTDIDDDSLRIGDRVEMTFRRLYTTSDGVHNYFWKARPCRDRRISNEG